MSDTDRILDLDRDDVIDVTLGGRSFTLRQQRRAVIEQVVRAVYAEEERAERELDDKAEPTGEETMRLLFENWERALPAYALMLGVEQKDEAYQETLDHLNQFLTFPKACTIFDRWYKLNQVERFFAYVGNPLIPEETYQRMLKARQRREAEPPIAELPSE